jgi:hypothetical protein
MFVFHEGEDAVMKEGLNPAFNLLLLEDAKKLLNLNHIQ